MRKQQYLLLALLTAAAFFVLGICGGMLAFLMLNNDPAARPASMALATPTWAALDSSFGERPESPALEATGIPLPPPPPEPAPPLTPTPTKPPVQQRGTSPELEILSHNTYVDEHGRHHIVGEIRNNGDSPAEYVEVVAQYFDTGESLTGANLTFTDPDTVGPGQIVPFDIVILRRKHWANGYNYELLVKGYATEETVMQNIIIISQNSRVEDGFLYVEGRVKNTGSEWGLVKVVVTLYDAAGQVINSRWDYIDKAMLAPGKLAEFGVRLEHQTDPQNFNYRLQIEEEMVDDPMVVDLTPTPWGD